MMVYAKGIVEKNLKVRIVDEKYLDNMVEVEILEGQFKGYLTTVLTKNIIPVSDVIGAELEEALKERNITYDSFTDNDSKYIYIEGVTYDINIYVCNDGTFKLDTTNKDKLSSYGNDDEIYKNRTTRKTTKGVLNYIYKYID